MEEFNNNNLGALPDGENPGGENPGGENHGGENPGGEGGGGSSSSSVTYSGATEITTAGTYSDQTYTSTTADENSVLISLSSGAVNLVNATVTKSGDSDGGDNCNFYGINSAVMATGGGTVSITGGNVTASAKGANGIFSYGGNGGTNGAAGDGTTVYITDTTINTTGDNGGGIMTTGGGVTIAKNLTITTTGQSSAPIRTDRGGGNVTVSGGSYTSSGLGSPAIYSTAEIVVEDATLTSNLSEGVCIEGQNSVSLTNCTLTASNTQTNGNAQFLDAVFLYQSRSGDAADGTSTFTMTGGTLNNTSGHLFHVTNTTAIINLNGVTINDNGEGILLSVCNDGWSGASNIATLNASAQTLDGDILVGNDSTLTLNLTDGTIFTGSIDGNISNNAGTSISTSIGTVNVSLDSDSKWYLNSDTYVSTFSGTVANVITGGYILYVNNVALDGTTEVEGAIENKIDNTLVSGTSDADTILNSGENVTIQALGGDDSITNRSNYAAIDLGAGNDSITNTGSNVTINGGEGNDVVYNNKQNSIIDLGAGDDSLHNYGENVSIDAGDGADTIENNSDAVTISGGEGNDYVLNTDNFVMINAGADADSINIDGASSTIFGGEGSDTISNYGENSSIVAGEGNDLIINNGVDATIDVSDGDDTITTTNYLANFTVKDFGAGDIIDFAENTIKGFETIDGGIVATGTNQYNNEMNITIGGVNSSLGSWSLNDNVAAYSSSTLSIVDNTIKYVDGENLVEISGMSTTDNLELRYNIINIFPDDIAGDVKILSNKGGYEFLMSGMFNGETFTATDNADSVIYQGASLNVYAGDGDDDIYNDGGNYATISGGAGNDTITNKNGTNVTLEGLDGDDYINSVSDGTGDVFLWGDDGNDTIVATYSKYSTIEGGKGDDLIDVTGASGIVFYYKEGDGNDTIVGFNQTSYLDVGDAEFNSVISGDNVIIGVGDESITLTDAATLPTFNSETPLEIENILDDVSIIGTAGNDTLSNGGENVTIAALGGNDIVTNYAQSAIIDGGEDSDTISNYGANSTIDGGEGNDSISNAEANYVAINMGDGDDSIYNSHAYYPTLEGGAGNDLIVVSRGNQTFIDGGEGNDTILGERTDEDSTWAMGGYAVINGGDGDDYIDPVFSDSAQIYGDEGSDTIINEGNDVIFNGGVGDDVISLRGASVEGNVIEYEVGDGNDIVYGFNETTTLKLATGTEYSTTESGNDVIVNVGDGAITIADGKNLSSLNIVNYEIEPLNVNNTADNVTITGTNLADRIENSGANVIVDAKTGNDSIFNSGTGVIVNAAAGNDSIYNSGASSTLNGDYGDDFVFNFGDNVAISGSYGNDTVQNVGDNVTIDGGGGNDSIVNGGENVVINYNGGNDTIVGFDETSTLQIDGEYSVIEGVKNILISKDEYFAILEDAMLNNDTININGEAIEVSKTIQLAYGGTSARVTRSNVNILGAVTSDTIFSIGDNVTIDGGEGDDLIVNSGENAVFVYNEGDGNDTIVGFNETSYLDTGDAEYSSVVSGNDVIITVGDSKITLKDAAASSDFNIEDLIATGLVQAMLLRTEEGYPIIAGQFFHPTEYHGEEPTGYDKETWTITSSDGLKLNAFHYTPENPNDKWAIIIHGYGHNNAHMYPFASQYLANNYNVLLVDQRAAGDSEGVWLTMGAAESSDIALWTQEIARHNSDAKIVLHGVSMGSATAMLTAARDDITNVVALVEDCGYTNVMEIVDIINKAALQQPQTVVDKMDVIAKSFTGYYLSDAAPIKTISNAKMPTLFITGSNDSVVPVTMLEELYDASGAEVKEKFIVEGATHGVAGLNDPVGYSNAVFRFSAEAAGEGWVTNNSVSSISLRGTKYGDNITNSGDNVAINTADGDDTITNSGSNVTIDAGAGENVINGGGAGNFVVLNGKTTVNNFNFGFGEGSDTVYITGDPAVDFKDEGLTLYYDNGEETALTFKDIDNTAQINFYYAANNVSATEVLIADDEWYQVSQGAADYYVGATAKMNHGIDYSGITSDVNVTLDTDYSAPDATFWVSNVYSVKGGDGNTTITGSAKSDTIIAGSGDTTIDAGDGDDLIVNESAKAFIDAGDGSNLIQMGDQNGSFIVFNGKTTVEGFNLGFGEGSDTIYVKGDPVSVDFKDEGLTFYRNDENLVLSDVTTTAKLNIYHERRIMTNKAVFIANDDWYSVESGDLSVKSGEEVYFVGASANPNHGVDFSGITSDLNVTIDTEYEIPDNSTWINGVYSLKGGSGNTTVTGSEKSDTIIAGSGKTTIFAGKGGDILTGNGLTLFNIEKNDSNATVNASAGDKIALGDEKIDFIKSGTAFIENGSLKSISSDAIAEINGEIVLGDDFDGATFVDGEKITLTAADEKIFVGSGGATLSGYNFNENSFIVDAKSASDLANKIDNLEFSLSEGIFRAENQNDVVLDDIDTSNGTFVKFITGDGKKSLFGWDPDGGGLLDGNLIDKKQILFGKVPGGVSSVRGGAKNDTIFAGTDGTVSLSGGEDKIYLYGSNVAFEVGNGEIKSRTTVVDGFDVENDVIIVNDAENLSVKLINDKLQVRKNNSVLIFDEINSFAEATGLQIQTGDEIYTLRGDYSGGLTKNNNFFWQDSKNNYFKPGTTFYVHDDGENREFFIESGCGKATIENFAFGTSGDTLNVKNAEQIDFWGENLFIRTGNDDYVFVKGGAGKIVNFTVDGDDFVGEIAKNLTYNDDANYFIGEKIAVGADYAADEVAIYMNGMVETNGKSKTYRNVREIDASAFKGQSTLVGGELDDIITASQGDSSLWGGNDSNDTLVGCGSGNNFFYFRHDGQDEIQNAADGDIVSMSDITLDDISSAAVNSSGVELKFNDGGSLTLKNSADVTFKFGDGTNWKANYQTRTFEQQA